MDFILISMFMYLSLCGITIALYNSCFFWLFLSLYSCVLPFFEAVMRHMGAYVSLVINKVSMSCF